MLEVPCTPFPAETIEALQAYSWPGNVRELRNIVERCLIMQGQGANVTVDSLPPHIANAANAMPDGPVAHAAVAVQQDAGAMREGVEDDAVSEERHLVQALLEMCIRDSTPSFARTMTEKAPWPISRNVAIIGGGLPGCEFGHLCMETGRTTAIIEERKKVGFDVGGSDRFGLISSFKQAENVEMYPLTRVTAITEEGVRAVQTTPEGDKELFIPAKTVAITLGLAEKDVYKRQAGNRFGHVSAGQLHVERQRQDAVGRIDVDARLRLFDAHQVLVDVGILVRHDGSFCIGRVRLDQPLANIMPCWHQICR